MKIFVTGDLMPVEIAKSTILQSGNVIGDKVLKRMQEADLRIINLECPLTSAENAILKTGKNFKSDVKIASYLKDIGVDIVCLANNHIMDYGIEGLDETISACVDNSISTIGVIRNNEVSIYRDKNSGLSIINVAEMEFGVGDSIKDGYYGLSIPSIFKKIQEEKAVSEYVILIVHGGREFHDLPSPDRVDQYRMFIEFGADAIVSHHTHTMCGYEYYKYKPIVYGLGNFIFPKNKSSNDSWDYGMTLELNFMSPKDIKLDFMPIVQKYSPYRVDFLDSEKQKSVLTNWNSKSYILSDRKQLQKRWEEYIHSQLLQYFGHLGLIDKFKIKLFRKKVLKKPPRPKMKDVLVQLNMLRCDAHREQAISSLKQYLKDNDKFYS